MNKQTDWIQILLKTRMNQSTYLFTVACTVMAESDVQRPYTVCAVLAFNAPSSLKNPLKYEEKIKLFKVFI